MGKYINSDKFTQFSIDNYPFACDISIRTYEDYNVLFRAALDDYGKRGFAAVIHRGNGHLGPNSYCTFRFVDPNHALLFKLAHGGT